MESLHLTTLSRFRQLQSFRLVRVDMLEPCCVRDDSMFPKLVRGAIVQVDTGALVKTGAIVAIETGEFVEFREFQIYDGEFYLVAHNKRFPTVSIQDYLALYPEAYLCGVVC